MQTTFLYVALWLTNLQASTPINSITQIYQIAQQMPEALCVTMGKEMVESVRSRADPDAALHGSVTCITMNAGGGVVRRITVFDERYAPKKAR